MWFASHLQRGGETTLNVMSWCSHAYDQCKVTLTGKLVRSETGLPRDSNMLKPKNSRPVPGPSHVQPTELCSRVPTQVRVLPAMSQGNTQIQTLNPVLFLSEPWSRHGAFDIPWPELQRWNPTNGQRPHAPPCRRSRRQGPNTVSPEPRRAGVRRTDPTETTACSLPCLMITANKLLTSSEPDRLQVESATVIRNSR
jgi:hypothetical protein